jgi:hypothetical protein
MLVIVLGGKKHAVLNRTLPSGLACYFLLVTLAALFLLRTLMQSV